MAMVLLQGNEACVEGAVAAGVEFFAGYPITPSTEIAEGLALKLPPVGKKFIQMEDEIGSMAAVVGASMAGLKSMTATSGPGFSLKQENLGYAVMTEVPCVVVNVMRGGPSTGLPTSPSQGDIMQARWGTHGDHPIIALCPSSVAETYELTIRSFNLAEKYRTPVILLLDEIVGHMREGMELDRETRHPLVERKKPSLSQEEYLPYAFTEDDIPPMAAYGMGYRFHATGLYHDETGFPSAGPNMVDRSLKRLFRKIEGNRDDIMDYVEEDTEDARIVVVAYGSTSRSALRAVREARKLGHAVGLFRPRTIWPFPEERMRALSKTVDTFVVPEMNMGQLIYEVERMAGGRARTLPLNKADGEPISPTAILNKIKEVL